MSKNAFFKKKIFKKIDIRFILKSDLDNSIFNQFNQVPINHGQNGKISISEILKFQNKNLI